MRHYRDAQYEAEHRASLSRNAQPPKNLLAWFLEAFRAEMPDRLNGHGTFVGRPDSPGHETLWAKKSKPSELVGGSLLGSPNDVSGFRRFIEDSPFSTEVAEYEGSKDRNGHYAFPLRAALARLAGRGRETDVYPFMARALYRTALRDGDYDGACASLGITEPVRQVYIEEALRRLWSKYAVEPPTRTLRESAA